LRVSIITITYNAEAFLERTIKSIIGQTSRDFEYLVIDGGSKDGTLKIIEQYREHIDYLVSEPDKGLYDAMNKGLQAATGDYVWFMNAGDEIYDAQVLEKVVAEARKGADVIWGETLFVKEGGEPAGLRSQVTPHKLPPKLTWKSLQMGMVVCHQSFIVRKAMAPLYDLSHPLSADVDWEIRCLKSARQTARVEGIVAKYLMGGLSVQHHRKSLLDRYAVMQKHYGTLPNLWNHFRIALRGALHKLGNG
jgi:glycosyltransferase involved in cell wall biosynthesis